MADVPIYILAGQSNAEKPGLDASLVASLSANAQSYELVKLAVGSTSLFQNNLPQGDWNPASQGELFDQLIADVQAREQYIISQGDTPVLATVFWVQGEADGRKSSTADAYEANLTTFIDDLRQQLDAPDLQFVISKLSDGYGIPFTDTIRAAQDEVASTLPNVVTVETNGLPHYNESVHYNMVGRFELGQMMAADATPQYQSAPGYVSLTTGETIVATPDQTNITGTLDSDTITGSNRNSHIDAGYGDNTVYGGSGDDNITAGFMNDVMHGGAGNDIIYGSPDYTKYLGTYSPGVTWNIDNDVLYGDAGNDQLYGGIGNDVLDGGTGVDVMVGGIGDDTYYVDNPRDMVIENVGEGNDTVYASVSYTLPAGQEIETLIANAGSRGLLLTGNEFANTIYGGSGSDRLSGGGGGDVLIGGLGNDIYYVTDSADQVIEAPGGGNDVVVASVNYTLGAGQEIEQLRAAANSTGLTLTGNEFANVLIGGPGNDVLNGGGGTGDRLEGGAGNDTLIVSGQHDVLTGGPGADTFVFNTVADSPAGAGRADITDFTPGVDLIDVSGIHAVTGASTDQAFTFIGTSAFTSQAGELRFMQLANSTLVEGVTDSSRKASFEISLNGVFNLQASDFKL